MAIVDEIHKSSKNFVKASTPCDEREREQKCRFDEIF